MTHHVVKVLEDGTRVYSNYTRYRPIPKEQRKYGVNKPDVEGAERRGGVWFLPLELLPPGERTMPETRPDDVAYDHMVKGRKCRCRPCQRPEAKFWQDKWKLERGLRP